MPTVTLGDGRKLTVGDEFTKMSPDDQQTWVNEVASNLPPPPRGLLDKAAGLYQSFDRGASDAAAGTLGLPRTLVDLGAKGISAASNKVADMLGVEHYDHTKLPPALADILPTKDQLDKFLPSSDQFQTAIQDMTASGEPMAERAIRQATGQPSGKQPAPLYEPQGEGEKFARTVGEFSGALLGGEGGVARRVLQTVVPAAASDVAGRATKDTALEPWARLAGAVVPGMAIGAVAKSLGGAETSIERALPQGVTGAHVDEAQALMRDAEARGIRLTWPEALSQAAQRPVLSDTMRHVEAAAPDAAADVYAGRPQAISQATGQAAAELSPGVPSPPSGVGPAAGRVAGQAINEARRDINDLAEPYYAATHTEMATPQQMARLRALPGWQDAADAVRNDPQLHRYVQGAPDESVAFLNEVRKYMVQQGENATQSLTTQGRNMQRAAGWQSDAAQVDRTARAASPVAYDTAQAIEHQLRGQFLQPMLEGPLGKLAKDDISTKNAIEALFPKDPLAHSQTEVGDAVREMLGPQGGPQRAVREKAASDLVRAHVEYTFNKAARDLQSGANPASGAKFRTALVGNPQQRANLQAAVEALPDGAQRWQGFNRYLDILEATGTRQNIGSKTAYNTEALKDLGGGAPGQSILKTIGNLPGSIMKPLAEKYDKYVLGRNLDELAEKLTDPQFADRLRQLAVERPNTRRSINIARSLAYTANPTQQRLYVSPQRDDASR